jgi:hypothetical protein
MNVFVLPDADKAGGMYIPDPTDYETWLMYTWATEVPDPTGAQISDGGWYQDLYNEDIIGPFNFYIYHKIYEQYDIPSCPTFFHNGIDAEGGIAYFDGQSEEQTAPAGDPDSINLHDRIHTSIYNISSEKVIWKKIDPEEETDYEFTPYQATVADGTNPAITAYDENVVIVYANEGNIKCVYSNNDGDTWSQPVTIGPGAYPDVYSYGDITYAAYVNDSNLYIVNSSDGGATWSSPNQINDADGTVVAEENCIDIHPAGVVWVDNRNGAKNIYYNTTTVYTPEPNIEIISISGGFGIKAELKNTGDAPAENINWNIKTTGLVLLGRNKSGQVTLQPGESITVKTGLMFGLGKIQIDVTADTAKKTANARILLFLVIGL